jgi:hypothetical protein
VEGRRIKTRLIIVDGYRPTAKDKTDLRRDFLSFALDQRAFGPRRLVVAFSDRNGRFTGLAYTPRTEPPEMSLGPCVDFVGQGSAAAVAFCDEPVTSGPPPPGLGKRFALARSIAAPYGVHLVDWFACDDQLFQSTRFALDPDCEWWDVP